ncbi:MAG: hypothetical protein ABI234_02420 [Ktedonobacteraceae bacterium]
MSESQVARLLNQIETEYIAAQRGLTGMAESAKHAAINARMENIGKLHQDLQVVVGNTAHILVAACLEAIPD